MFEVAIATDRRFEAYYDEWDGWCIRDHATSEVFICEDRHSAEREADSLETVDQLVRHTADHFTDA